MHEIVWLTARYDCPVEADRLVTKAVDSLIDFSNILGLDTHATAHDKLDCVCPWVPVGTRDARRARSANKRSPAMSLIVVRMPMVGLPTTLTIVHRQRRSFSFFPGLAGGQLIVGWQKVGGSDPCCYY